MQERTVEFSPDLLSEVFPYPAVKEVAFEIRFDPHLKIVRLLPDFQDRVREECPTVSLNEAVNIEGELVPATSFRSLDGSKTVRITLKSFGLWVSKYESFESLKLFLHRNLLIFQELVPIPLFRRAGLRYINSIDVSAEHNGYSVPDYVHPLVDLSRFRPTELLGFAGEVRLRRELLDLTIRGGFLRQAAEGALIYVLDLDASREELNGNEIETFLEHAHAAIQQEFLGSVTERQLARMRGH